MEGGCESTVAQQSVTQHLQKLLFCMRFALFCYTKKNSAFLVSYRR